MNNDAFKDLVRTKINTGSSSTSKEIARKAVEEEFRKKKKRKRGGDYASSSDEEDDGGRKQQSSSKWKDDHYDCDKKEDDVKAIQEDLATRYRDRAKERREGTASSFLIIPHNKKGLDIALARKERQGFKLFGGKSITTTVTPNATTRSTDKNRNVVDEVHCKIKKELPSSDEAKSILQEFVSSKNSIDNIDNNRTHTSLDNDNSIILGSGMTEYIKEVLTFDTTSSSWDKSAIASSDTDRSNASTAGKNLQRTIYSLAIDGHPSDLKRAWEIPRQYSLSGGGEGSSGKSPALLSNNVMDKIDLVFKSRNIIRNEMIKEKIGSRGMQSMSTKSEAIYVKETTNKGNSNTYGNSNMGRIDDNDDDDDDDDDMFGGLDD